EHVQAENFRKMLLAMARDVRVILIKLADRLHNMRTLDAMAHAHRRRIARETLDIYAPIANRLGLNSLYLELQDLSFKHLYPMRYRILASAIKAARGNRREVMNRLLDVLREGLAHAQIPATVAGREKTIYSVYKKMLEKHYTFSQVFDIYGVRVLVADKNACYAALGVLHGLYKPIPGKFKDYVAIPKANGYQSLHTTLFGPFGTPLEAQIRTHDMHRIAEAGVAAHWLYKQGGQLDLAEAQRETHRWLQSLLEIQSESRDSKEFLEHIKGDLFPEEIYVFTPKGKIMALPRGATAVDFAYGVHTDIGHHCVAARINYELLPLRTELKNGDHVEILTSPTARPNPSWLSFVATGKARSRIRHYLKGLQQKESAALGERLLNQALATLKVEPEAITWDRWEALAKEYGTKSHLDILADIGLGKRLSFVVAQALTRPHGKNDEPAAPSKSGALSLRGVEGVAIQYARCCRPIPGDAIVGQFRKGHGLIVHLRDCVTLRKQRVDIGELVDVEWSPDVQGVFDAGVRVLVSDRRGLLADLATSIGNADANIDTVSMERPDGDEVLAMFFSVQVRDRRHLAQVMRAMRHVPNVKRVQRART
ncbi:MAG TPA: bifunctional (p)ppGpp synthetase/guanosine-3',5'-bis(diphosphate) 3'-pyrophosphohydrolase, partial [Thermoanaerobaculia bacterium]|nr:bifunctional (p)ppGpp synthetase/guanosine-3',5'-bis(diphosphate) 3'-pyrophosphohydrolase [Thermoanaerobaculia bacterium]